MVRPVARLFLPLALALALFPPFVLALSACGSVTNAPETETETGTVASALCSRVTLSVGLPNPVGAGSKVPLTAGSPACAPGETPEYRFLYRLSGTTTYSEIRGWGGAGASWSTTGVPSGKYDVTVYTRAAGSTAAKQSSATKTVLVGNVCTGVTAVTSPPSPQLAGTPIALGATAICIGGNAEYQFSYRADGTSTYVPISGWVRALVPWDTTGLPDAVYTLRVYARVQGNTSNFEASDTMTFRIGDLCTAASLAAAQKSPRPAGPAVMLGATATCITGTPEYSFSHKPPGATAYTELRGWGGPVTAFRTAGLPAGVHSLRVLVRAVGSAEAYQSQKSLSFTLTAPLWCSPDGEPSPGACPPAPSIDSLVAGHDSTCGLRADRSVVCWGDNSYGSSIPPAGPFEAVSIGRLHKCGVRPDGALVCWGLDSVGETVPPPGTFKAVAAGTHFTCALRTDGTATCWGMNQALQLAAPAGTFTSVVAGEAHACALRTNGTIACWGAVVPNLGQASPPSGTFTALSAGQHFNCARRTNGTVACWGDNGVGQASPPAGSFASIAAGAFHACGVRPDGTAVCWGYAFDGQTAVPPGLFTQLGGGIAHTCGLRPDHLVECWGAPNTPQTLPPTFPLVDIGGGQFCALQADGSLGCWLDNGAPVPEGPFAAFASGGMLSCALDAEGAITCWGSAPTSPPPGPYVAVAGGFAHACAIRPGGAVTCWGDNWSGQTDPPDGAFTALAGGHAHTCGLLANGTAACWGLNANGQSSPPTGAFKALAAGYDFTCGVRTNGKLACWGAGHAGILAPPTGTFTALAAGDANACALRTDGSVACWGESIGAAPAGPFRALASNAATMCGVRPSGAVQCWGEAPSLVNVE